MILANWAILLEFSFPCTHYDHLHMIWAISDIRFVGMNFFYDYISRIHKYTGNDISSL